MQSLKCSGYHHGDLRNALLNISIRLLKEKGPKSISLRAIAKMAGVSHAAPYRHFKDKMDVLVAIAQKGFEHLSDELSTVCHYFKSPTQQLEEVAIVYVKNAVYNPEFHHLMFGGIIPPGCWSQEMKAASEKTYQSLVQIVKNGQAHGLYSEIPTMQLTLMLWSSIHGLAGLLANGYLAEVLTSEDHIKDMATGIIDTFQSGILKRSPAPVLTEPPRVPEVETWCA